MTTGQKKNARKTFENSMFSACQKKIHRKYIPNLMVYQKTFKNLVKTSTLGSGQEKNVLANTQKPSKTIGNKGFWHPAKKKNKALFAD